MTTENDEKQDIDTIHKESITIETIREEIAKTLDSLFSTGKADVKDYSENSVKAQTVNKTEDASVEVAEEVRKELQRLKDAKAAEDWRGGIESEVERLKGLAEASPIETSRITKFFGWDKP